VPTDGLNDKQTPVNPAVPKPGRPTSEDEICWQAEDGQVCLLIKAWPRRWPQSTYPVLVAALRPKDHTRIQRLDDGSGGVEALFTYYEIEQLVEATNQIAARTGKGKLYEILQRVPPKDPARKQKWDRINQAHHRRKERGNGGPCH
jgi:hypothetical protein